MADRATIRAQIVKLLSMTLENGCSPEEAATAAAMAQRLLTKFKLDLHEIEQLAANKGDGFIKRDFAHAKHTVDATWCRSLVSVVADAFYCDYLFTNGDSTRGWIIGQPGDIDIVEYIHGYLYRTIARLIRERWRAEHERRLALYGDPNWPTLLSPFKWRRSYALGAVSAIQRTVQQMRRADAAEDSNCTALVLVNRDALDAAKHRFFSKITKARSATREKDVDAYVQGYEDGQDITINPALGSQPKASALTA